MSNTARKPTPVELLALTKVTLDKFTKKSIKPQTYKGEMTVRVAYDLKVGAPFGQRHAPEVPWMRIAALALSKLNEVSAETVIREAVSMDTTTAVEDEIALRAKKIVDELLTSVTKEMAGKVTGTVGVEIVEEK